jgi:hypothetical protein
MENVIKFTPATGPTAAEQLQELFDLHRILCRSCPFIDGPRCKLCRTCPGDPWKRPRCPAGRWWDFEYNDIAARLQPQRIDPAQPTRD